MILSLIYVLLIDREQIVMYKCSRCNTDFLDGVQCSVCKNRYDFPCAGITEAGYRKLGDRKFTWKCSVCKNSSPTPTKSPDLEGILAEIKYLSAQLAPLPGLVESVKIIKEEVRDLKSIKTELLEVKSSVSSVQQSMVSLTERLTQLDSEVQSLQSAKQQLITLQQRVEQLERRADEDQQRSRLNNIEIKGVPFKSTENLYNIIHKIGDTISCSIPKEQINYIVRVPTRGDNTTKNIIVSLHNRYLKEDFIVAARRCKLLTASSLGFSGDKRIFVNDHLTLQNKTLLNKAKTLAKERKFEFIWVKSCRIFIRKNNTSPVIRINSELDLKRISC